METVSEQNIYVLEKHFNKPKKELINNDLLNLNKNEFNCQKKSQKFMDSLILMENFKNDFLTLLFKTKNNNFSKKNINNVINRLFLLYHTDIIDNYYEKSKQKINIDINKLLINLPNNYKNILLNHNETKQLPVDIKNKQNDNNSKTLNKDEIKNTSKNIKYNSNFTNIENDNLNCKKTKKTNIMDYLKNKSTIRKTENIDNENIDNENIDNENIDNENINNIDNKTRVTIKRKKVLINSKLKKSKSKNNINKNKTIIKNNDLKKKEKTDKKDNSSNENIVKKKRGRKRKVELNDKFSDPNYITVWPEIWNGQKVLIDMDNHIFTFDKTNPKYIGKKKIDNKLEEI